MATQTPEAAKWIEEEAPYTETFRLKGTTGFLFSKPPEDIDKKPPKTFTKEHAEEKVWRNLDGALAYSQSQFVFRLAVAGKGWRSPISEKKGTTAEESIRQAITVHDADQIGVEGVISFENDKGKPITEWDSIARHWVGGKKASYRRSTLFIHRPYLEPGWEMEMALVCAYPQWFTASHLHKLVSTLGLIGIGDGTVLGYGRFVIIRADPPETVNNWI